MVELYDCCLLRARIPEVSWGKICGYDWPRMGKKKTLFTLPRQKPVLLCQLIHTMYLFIAKERVATEISNNECKDLVLGGSELFNM